MMMGLLHCETTLALVKVLLSMPVEHHDEDGALVRGPVEGLYLLLVEEAVVLTEVNHSDGVPDW